MPHRSHTNHVAVPNGSDGDDYKPAQPSELISNSSFRFFSTGRWLLLGLPTKTHEWCFQRVSPGHGSWDWKHNIHQVVLQVETKWSQLPSVVLPKSNDLLGVLGGSHLTMAIARPAPHKVEREGLEMSTEQTSCEGTWLFGNCPMAQNCKKKQGVWKHLKLFGKAVWYHSYPGEKHGQSVRLWTVRWHAPRPVMFNCSSTSCPSGYLGDLHCDLATWPMLQTAPCKRWFYIL